MGGAREKGGRASRAWRASDRARPLACPLTALLSPPLSFCAAATAVIWVKDPTEDSQGNHAGWCADDKACYLGDVGGPYGRGMCTFWWWSECPSMDAFFLENVANSGHCA